MSDNPSSTDSPTPEDKKQEEEQCPSSPAAAEFGSLADSHPVASSPTTLCIPTSASSPMIRSKSFCEGDGDIPPPPEPPPQNQPMGAGPLVSPVVPSGSSGSGAPFVRAYPVLPYLDDIAPPSVPPPPEDPEATRARLLKRRGTIEWSSASSRAACSDALSDGSHDQISSPDSSGHASPRSKIRIGHKPRCSSMCAEFLDIPPPPVDEISSSPAKKESSPLNETTVKASPTILASTVPLSPGDSTRKTKHLSAKVKKELQNRQRTGTIRGSAASRISIVQFSRDMYKPTVAQEESLMSWDNFNDLLDEGSKQLNPVLSFPDLLQDVAVQTIEQHQDHPVQHLTMEKVAKEEPSAETQLAEDLCKPYTILERKNTGYRVELISTSQSSTADSFFLASDDPCQFFSERTGGPATSDFPLSPSYSASPSVQSATSTVGSSSSSDSFSVESSNTYHPSEGGVAENVERPNLKQQAIQELECDPPGPIETPLKLETKLPKARTYDISIGIKSIHTIASFGPLFCTLAVYDSRQRAKVSEDCHFHMNSANVMDNVGLGSVIKSHSSLSNILVSLPYKSKDFWVVICAYRLLHGDLDKDLSSSQRGKLDSSAMFKDLKALVEANKDHGWDAIPREPLFWCPMPLFTDADIEAETMCNTVSSTWLVTAKGVLTDDVLFQLVGGDQDRIKKFKIIPGLVEITVDEKPSELLQLDHMLYPVFTEEEAKARRHDPMQKVARMFYPVMQPYLEYENLLYVYPEGVTVKSTSGSSNLLQVSVQLMNKNQLSDTHRSVYPPMYSYPSDGPLRPPELLSEGFGAVRSKERQFPEEVKVELPLSLKDMCLVFTIYGVPLRSDTMKISRIVLGCAAMELLHEEEGSMLLMPDGQYTLPVVLSPSDLTGCNIQPLNEESAKRAKYTFTFQMRSFSSVFAKDWRIHSFLTRAAQDAAAIQKKSCPGEKQPCRTVLDRMRDADRIECSHHLFTLLRCYLQSMVLWEKEDPDASVFCFCHILLLLEKVFDRGGGGNNLDRSFSSNTLIQVNKNTPALTYFLNNMYDPVSVSQGGRPVHEVLTKNWLHLMHKVKLETLYGITANSQFNWFLLRLISKSATVFGWNERKNNPSGPRITCSPQFEEDTVDILKRLLIKKNRYASSGVVTVADFIKEMFTVMHSGHLFYFIQDFLSTVDAENTDTKTWLSVKYAFLNTIVKYEHFIQLNLPLPPDEEKITCLNDIYPVFRQSYPLIGMILDQVSICLAGAKEDIQNPALKLVRTMLLRASRDKRFQNEVVRERITTMFFPLVLTALSQAQTLILNADSQKSRQTIILTSLLWVLKHCSDSLLHTWWNKDNEKGHELFFSILAHCIVYFKNKPYQQEAIVISCRCIEAFLKDHAASMEGPKNPLFDVVMDCVTRSLSYAAEFALPETLKIASVLLQRYPEHFCLHLGNAYINTLSYEMLKRVSENELPPALFSQFVDTFYLQLTCVFQHAISQSQGDDKQLRNLLKRLRTRIIVGMSNLVGEGTTVNTTYLPKFFAAVDSLAANDSREFTNDSSFRKLIHYTSSHMKSLLDLYTKILATTDPDVLRDLYYEAIKFNVENPEMRIRWLCSLERRCEESGNWEEAAQCNIIQAYLISRYLTDICHGHYRKTDFGSLIPNLGTEVTRIDTRVAEECGLFQGDCWSLEHMVNLLSEAASILKKGSYFEQCIEIYTYIANIWKRKRNYGMMSRALSDTTATCLALAEKEKERENFLFARYYRVAFYGELLGSELNNKEFIYKRPPSEVIAVVQQQIRNYLVQKVGDEKLVELLPNLDTDMSTLDPKKVYFQMISTEPFLDDEKGDISTSFDKHFGAHKFLAVQAYVGEGSTQNRTESLKEQRKKKILYEAELKFPFVKNRLRVIKTSTAILEPMENAIELTIERCERLIVQLENNPPRIKQLQQVLQGSVAVMVNKGMLEICEIFLSPEARAQEDPELVKKLATGVSNFLELCAALLQLNSTIIPPEQLKFQSMLVQQYEVLYNKALVYIEACGCRIPRKTYSLEDAERNVWRELPRVTLDVKYTEGTRSSSPILQSTTPSFELSETTPTVDDASISEKEKV